MKGKNCDFHTEPDNEHNVIGISLVGVNLRMCIRIYGFKTKFKISKKIEYSRVYTLTWSYISRGYIKCIFLI